MIVKNRHRVPLRLREIPPSPIPQSLEGWMRWLCTHAYDLNSCPVLVAARNVAVQKWNDHARRKARSGGNIGAAWHMPVCEIAFSRRPNLTEYDNRRDLVTVDRYYMGIYPME